MRALVVGETVQDRVQQQPDRLIEVMAVDAGAASNSSGCRRSALTTAVCPSPVSSSACRGHHHLVVVT